MEKNKAGKWVRKPGDEATVLNSMVRENFTGKATLEQRL